MWQTFEGEGEGDGRTTEEPILVLVPVPFLDSGFSRGPSVSAVQDRVLSTESTMIALSSSNL